MGNGEKEIRNLSAKNVYRDKGKTDEAIVLEIERQYQIKFPDRYSKFIVEHNGARLIVDSFNFYDNDVEQQNSASIAFIPVEKIPRFIQGLLNESINDPDYFSQKLIPFGDDGGGNYMCFDYRKHEANNPPIIYWNHSVYENSKRISFIADNFEEFINMLHEPED